MCSGTDSAATVKGDREDTPESFRIKTQRDTLEQQYKSGYIGKEDYENALARLAENERRVGLAADPTKDSASYLQHEKVYQGFTVAPPPDAPDLTDDLLRKRRAAETLTLMTGRGRKDTMRPTTFTDIYGQKK